MPSPARPPPNTPTRPHPLPSPYPTPTQPLPNPYPTPTQPYPTLPNPYPNPFQPTTTHHNPTTTTSNLIRSLRPTPKLSRGPRRWPRCVPCAWCRRAAAPWCAWVASYHPHPLPRHGTRGWLVITPTTRVASYRPHPWVATYHPHPLRRHGTRGWLLITPTPSGAMARAPETHPELTIHSAGRDRMYHA